MAFVINTWTDAGRSLVTSIVAGGGSFNITRVQMGNGYPVGADNPATFVGLKHYVMDGVITSINVEYPFQATVRIRAMSQSAPQTFNWNEFGLYANSGSGNPVLIAYGTSGDNSGDTITPSSSAANVNRDCAVVMPFTANITVVTSATLNPVPELHAVTHRSTGEDPLAIAQTSTSGVAPASPGDATQVLTGSSPASWAKTPLHGVTHLAVGRDPIPLTSTSSDGLCPQLNGNQLSTLRGDGSWGTGFVPGLILEWAGSAPPSGWLNCDGQLHAVASYPALFNAIGYAYGGGGGSFAVPDCRGRTTVGAGQGPGLANRGLTATGGEETHTLSPAEMPYHNHGVNDPGHAHGVADYTHSHSLYDPTHAHSLAQSPHAHSIADPGHSHQYPGGPPLSAGIYPTMYSQLNQWNSTQPSGTGIGIYGANANIGVYGAATGMSVYASGANIAIYGAGTGISTQYAGGNAPANNMPPFIALNKIIRT